MAPLRQEAGVADRARGRHGRGPVGALDPHEVLDGGRAADADAQGLGGQEELGGEDIGLALDLPVGGLPGSSDVAVEHQVTDLVSQVEARALRR